MILHQNINLPIYFIDSITCYIFQPPQNPDAWDGIRDATNHPPPCTQKSVFLIRFPSEPVIGQEDCLYLNVFTPSVSIASFC